jgi:GT2 family glycosyltransferase
MHKKPKIYVIIINWNGISDTIECIRSLEKIKYNNYHIKIIDNSPTDMDYLKLKEKLPENDIEKVSDNGFSAANNYGIKQALNDNYEYILLLNNDTIVHEDFLEKLISDPSDNIGIYSPKIYYYNNKNIIWSAGGNISIIRATGYSSATGKNHNKFTDNKYVTFVSGCCMLINANLLRQIGLLDEKYFLYIEDTDFCERTIQAGYKIKYVADSIIYHKVRSSTRKTQINLPLYYATRNRLYFAHKYFRKYLFCIKTYIYLSMVIKGIGWVMNGQIESIKMVINGISDFNKMKMGKKSQ